MDFVFPGSSGLASLCLFLDAYFEDIAVVPALEKCHCLSYIGGLKRSSKQAKTRANHVQQICHSCKLYLSPTLLENSACVSYCSEFIY